MEILIVGVKRKRWNFSGNCSLEISPRGLNLVCSHLNCCCESRPNQAKEPLIDSLGRVGLMLVQFELRKSTAQLSFESHRQLRRELPSTLFEKIGKNSAHEKLVVDSAGLVSEDK